MFGWEFPPHITGGLGTACYGLTRGLAKQNVEVLFVVPRSFGDEDQRSISLLDAGDVEINYRDDIYREFWEKVTYMEIGSNIVPYLDPEEFSKLESEWKLDHSEFQSSVFSQKFKFSGSYGKNLMQEVARYAIIAASLASRHTFDIIHAHDWLTYPAGIAAKKISGKPLVVHVHATEFDRSGEHVNQNVYDIERKGMEASDLVITVSNLTRNIVIEKYGIDPNKVVTVHNAVEPVVNHKAVEYKKTVNEKIVTFLGRVTFQKGPEYFVEVAKRVLDKDPNVRFVMAGSGDMLNKMIRRVAQLGISSKFHFTGFLKGDDVDHMFDISDVYVMPSVSEPFGISPLEAMRSNTPVVISKQSGVAEVLRHALKVDFWDIDAMANAIYGLLHYPALSSMFIRLGKEEVDNLKWENAAIHIVNAYKSVLKI